MNMNMNGTVLLFFSIINNQNNNKRLMNMNNAIMPGGGGGYILDNRLILNSISTKIDKNVYMMSYLLCLYINHKIYNISIQLNTV